MHIHVLVTLLHPCTSRRDAEVFRVRAYGALNKTVFSQRLCASAVKISLTKHSNTTPFLH